MSINARVRRAVTRLSRSSSAHSGPLDKDLLRQILPHDPIIVDAGAHKGDDTVEFATRWRSGHVHAFEPAPAIYEELVHATARLRNVTTYPCALGKAPGRAQLHVSGGASDASSSLRTPAEHLRFHPRVSFDETVDVEVTTLDRWAADHAIDRVDCLWLDMQGYELDALRAGTTVLKTVRAIVTEVFLIELYDGAPLWPEARQFFADHGFTATHEEFWPDSGNVLLVRTH